MSHLLVRCSTWFGLGFLHGSGALWSNCFAGLRTVDAMRRGRDLERGSMSGRSSPAGVPHDPWANAAAQRFGRVEGMSAGACEGSSGRSCVPVMPGGQGVAFGTVPVSTGDATRMSQAAASGMCFVQGAAAGSEQVRVPSTPGQSSGLSDRPAAKARSVPPPGPTAPFAHGVTHQGESESQLASLTAMMQNVMNTMSSFQTEVANRLAVLETRENVNLRNTGQGLPSQTFGVSYAGAGDGGSFARIGSPIRREDTRLPREEVDVFSKSEKWLPQPPVPDCEKWVNRESEIEGFFTYVQALRSWSMLASDKLATEISQAMAWPEEIVTSQLTAGQQARSARLFAILRAAFSNHPRVDSLIRAFEAGAPIHNSPMKPFGSCGFELLRVLGLEFALRTRTEAICLRSELMKKEFRVDSRSSHMVSDLLRAMAVETSRYDKLVSTLPPTVTRSDLSLSESDQALIFIRNLPPDARQFVLLHACDDGLVAMRDAGLKYERQQRLYQELGTLTTGRIRAVQGDGEDQVEEGDWDEGGVDALSGKGGVKCTRCGKKHETSKCTTDLKSITCFRCGVKGHIGANCRNPSKTKDSRESQSLKKDPKGKDVPPPKQQKSGKGSGKTGKKGKMFEVGEHENEQEEPGPSAEAPEGISMALFGACDPTEFVFEILEVRPVNETPSYVKIASEKFLGISCFACKFANQWMGKVLQGLFLCGCTLLFGCVLCAIFGTVKLVAAANEHVSALACARVKVDVGWFGEDGSALGLLDCNCTSRHWTDFWVGKRFVSHWKDHGFDEVVAAVTLDRTDCCGGLRVERDALISCLPETLEDPEALSCQHHTCLNPLLNSVQEEGDWWLVDSGASVSVLSSKNVGNYKIISREPFASSGFFAANGSPVAMFEKVKLEVVVKGFKNGSEQEVKVVIVALVGETKNNILSTGSLIKNGWSVCLSESHLSMKHRTGLECLLEEWGGCPWISLQGTIPCTGKPSNSTGRLNVVRYGGQPDELHRARGHQPFDPNCKICVGAKTVGQHRRKRTDAVHGSVIELHADFFFLEGKKFLIVAELSSHMIGALWMSPNSDVNHRNLTLWLQELGCLGGDPHGVLHVFTDDERAVGAVFEDSQLPKAVKVVRAGPQNPETNGLAERSIRNLKETFVVLRTDIRESAGLDIATSGQALHECVMYIAHMSNTYVGVHGTSKSAREFLEGRKHQTPMTSSFGAIVLCELPDSVRASRKNELPRFVEGAYVRPAFGSKSHECIIQLDGECKRIRPKSIKLVLPLRWELSLVTGLLNRFSGENAEPSFSEPVRVSQHPPETEPVCPRSGPPTSWFDEHGKYTPGCAACKNIELGLSRGGKVHSAKCCQDYVKWLKSEREKLVESPNLGPAGAYGDVEVPVPRDVEESLSVDRNFDYSPEVEVEKEAEEVLVPGGIFDKALSRDVPMESEQTLKSEIAVAPALRPEAVNTRGVKRTASPVDLEHELEKDAADPVSRGTKRSLEEETEDMNSVFDAERMSECMSPSTLSGLLTYPVLVENYTLTSIFFGQDAGYEIVDLCGVKAKLWIPKGAIDDSTMGPLPSDHCFAGMKTEIANLSRCEAGIPKRYDEASAFC